MAPRRSQPRKRPPVCGDPNDPHGLYVWMRRYLSWLAVRNYSAVTIEQRTLYLSLFVSWADARGLRRPDEVTKPILEGYQRHLYQLRQKRNGKPLTFRSQYTRLVPVRAFFKWLTRQNVIGSNPASELVLPKLERRLPPVMTVAEVEQVMELADLTEPLGLRDRAMMEVLYSTGVRRMELMGLSVWDLDARGGTLLVRQGKGARDRVVPIGQRAIAWVRRYLDSARPLLVVPPDEGVLFVGQLGGSLSKNHLTRLIRRYVLAAEIGKVGSCHLFRHTMATAMLEHGADIRFIQQMLGHRDISSTQLYTRVSIKQLKKVHALTHPAAEMPKRGAGGGSGGGSGGGGGGGGGDHVDGGGRGELDELLGDLAAEGDGG